MTDTVPDPEEDRIRAALPGLRGRRILAGVGIALTATAGFAGTIFGISLGGEGWKLGAFAAILAGFGCFWIARQTARAHEAELMPIIAGTFGLAHQKNGRAFLRAAPAPFLPMGGVQSGDDVLAGRLAGRAFTWAEVKTETGGKSSRVLFRGLLLEVPAPGTPAVLAVPEVHTRPGLILRADIDVQGKRWLGRDAGGGPGGTELYSTDNTPMPGPLAGQLLERLMRLGEPVGGTFFAAAFTGHSLWVAISHDRDLFAIGGIMADHHSIMEDIRRAAQDFAPPLALAGRAMELADWLAAEVAKTPA